MVRPAAAPALVGALRQRRRCLAALAPLGLLGAGGCAPLQQGAASRALLAPGHACEPEPVRAPGSAPAAWLALPLRQAWVDGRRVQYISTDVSDAAVALELGINHVARLRLALPPPAAQVPPLAAPGGSAGLAEACPPQGPRSMLERVYVFAGQAQLSVFASAPRPAGAGNIDAAYSPLWRQVRVTWREPSQARELRSEEAVLAAHDRGELTLLLTDVVLNCPVIRSADGAALSHVRELR